MSGLLEVSMCLAGYRVFVIWDPRRRTWGEYRCVVEGSIGLVLLETLDR